MINSLFNKFKNRGNSIITSNGKTIINGKGVTINNGKNITIDNGVVIVDGVVQAKGLNGQIVIRVEGSLANLTADAPVTVNGNIYGNVSANGSVACTTIKGNVTSNGFVTSAIIGGQVL